jgi:Flp pilus assembly pilin Flp
MVPYYEHISLVWTGIFLHYINRAHAEAFSYEVTTMAKLNGLAYRLWIGLLADNRAQDMIEYSLLAAAIAVIVAGFLPPAIMPSVSTIFSKVVSGFNAS